MLDQKQSQSSIFVGRKQNYSLHQNQMDNNYEASVLDHSNCNISEMIHKEHHKDYQLWYDPILKREYCQYKLYGWPNKNQIEIYDFRKRQSSNLVYVHYIELIKNVQYKKFKIFVQRIPIRLSFIGRLSFLQGLCIIKEALKGFQTIFKRFGYVHIDDKLIGINYEGSVKVWTNQNFAYNNIASTHIAPKWMTEQVKIKQLISSLFSLVQDKLQKNSKLSSFKKEKQLKLTNLTFEKTILFLDNYSKLHKIIIPSSVPELLRCNSNQYKKQQVNSQNKIKQPLTFKKLAFSPKLRSHSKKYKPLLTIQTDNILDNLAPTTSRTNKNKFKLLSPAPSIYGNLGIRDRNTSQITVSVVGSRAKTVNHFKNNQPRKYFCHKSVRNRIQSVQREHITLQSSLISNSGMNNNFLFSLAQKNAQKFNFCNFNSKQKTKQNQKKRKYSAADQVPLHSNGLIQKSKTNKDESSNIARSLVMKNNLQASRSHNNPQFQLKNCNVSPSINIQIPIDQSLERIQSQTNSPLLTQGSIQRTQSTYSTKKPFLNYKALKNSIVNPNFINQIIVSPQPKLRSQLLNSMQLKSSQIIQRSQQQYANLKQIMKPIKQIQIQTPLSETNNDDFNSCERNFNMFIMSPQKRLGSEINTSNTSDHRSTSFTQRKQGLINFASPNNTVKQGMFKSILVGQLKNTGIKQVSEVDLQ